MESRIEKTFKKTRAHGRLALMPYLTGGYPTLADCLEVPKLLADLGCDLIELGVPFSDPLADGPTIQRSIQVALSQGVNLDHIFELVRDLKTYADIPVCLMPYYNIPYRYWLGKFARKAAKSGVDGVIIHDLYIEDAESWRKVAWKEGLDTVFLATPTSSLERIKRISQLSKGFIYCV
ncbi:tryptophan synthase subunit alpha, partial [Candidatus Hakubella thermalkaliphila]